MDLQAVIGQIAQLPSTERTELLRLLEELDTTRSIAAARKNFLPFVENLWPAFIEGPHHRIIAELFDDVMNGKKRRVIINMAPRHTKSEFASVYLPAFFLGRSPEKKIIQASHTADLAVGFGRRVRNIINSPEFHKIFPGVSLAADSKAAGRWATNKGGEYYALGVNGAVTGKGADLFIIDDPHSEQEAVLAESNPEIYDSAYDWYQSGPRQRLQPGGAIIVVMTRWSMRDLTAQLLKKQLDAGTDQWEIIELPAVLPEERDIYDRVTKPERPIWPAFWSMEELNRTKASIPVSKWNAQYQQKPTSEEGALIKREYWQDWTESKPPEVEAIIQSWDTAFTASTRADYSAVTTWGVFKNKETDQNNLILLDAVRGKWEFPELKQKALKYYQEWEPDICLIEARAAGQPLIYEMRRMGIPIQDVKVGRGTVADKNDKISRVNSITDIFFSKVIWAPKDRTFAQEVMEECAAFPAGEHDDFVDTVTMAVARYRQGGWINSNMDEAEVEQFQRNRKYY